MIPPAHPPMPSSPPHPRRALASRRSLLFRQMPAALLSALVPRWCLGSDRTPAPPNAQPVLDRAAGWLWKKQGEDGGWHSETYGLLRSGQALSPFILHALLGIPPEIHTVPRPAVERTFDFIRRRADSNGVLGLADPDFLEYPNYATAFALRCLHMAGRREDAELIGKMHGHLLAEQYGRERGFDESHPAFGGWGFGGKHPPGQPGHMDLSHTRAVLEALREAGVQEAAVFERAQAFLRLVQRHPSEARPQPPLSGNPDRSGRRAPYDGGFYFSPVVLPANKALAEPGDEHTAPHFRSYATATGDGLLALLAAGAPAEDERVRAARKWLESHPRLDYPEGVPARQPLEWGKALFFYHLAARAEAYRALQQPGGWREEIAKLLQPLQRPGGSFLNDRSHLMKEDDPLLATALAVKALGAIL
ncbi:MAG: hypothetical protein HY717_17045 [Planctomycetes bacterium]|nr:hypothetical protein [Planctomycetota bacterium]